MKLFIVTRIVVLVLLSVKLDAYQANAQLETGSEVSGDNLDEPEYQMEDYNLRISKRASDMNHHESMDEIIDDHYEYDDDEVEGRARLSMRYRNKKLGEITGSEPLMHIGYLPTSDAHIGTRFTLVMMKKCHDASVCKYSTSVPIHYDTIRDQAGDLSPCEVLAVTIHGFDSKASALDDLNKHLERFHSRHFESACLLIVDWSKGAKARLYGWFYNIPAVNTITVGRQLALLLFEMIDLGMVRAIDIHLISHSLGAQVAHQASEWLRHLTKNDPHAGQNKLGRITGLDPAAWKFQGYPGTHLVKEDAYFVDIIHTSIVKYGGGIRDFLKGRFGTSELWGSVDFFPNGGKQPQPGCPRFPFASISAIACSHNKAIYYFIKSLSYNYFQTHGLYDEVFPSFACGKHLTYSIEDQAGSSMGQQSVYFEGRGRQCLSI